MKNNKGKILILSIFSILIILILVLVVKFTGNNHGDGAIMAKIGKDVVYESEVKDRMLDIMGGLPSDKGADVDLNNLSKDIVKMLVRDILVERKMDKDVKKSGILKSEDFKKELVKFKTDSARNMLLDNMIKEEVSDDILKSEYEKTKSQLVDKKERKIRHILVKTEDEAINIRKNIAGRRMSFESAARKNSEDSGSASNGGLIGYVLEDSLVKQFGEVAFSLKKWDVSDPVRTMFGWHIIRVEDERDAKVPDFEETKGKIENELRNKIVKNYIEKLVNVDEIEILYEEKKEEANEIEDDLGEINIDDDEENIIENDNEE